MVDDLFSSSHPLLPPKTEDDQLDWLRLLRSRRVGISTFYRLLAEHGTAQNALEHLPDIAQSRGLAGYRACSQKDAMRELSQGIKYGTRLVFRGQPDYPKQLGQISDAPPLIWACGDLNLTKRPVTALVGARNASALVCRMARRLSHDLGQAGDCIVSGLARGIDAAAHQAALETGTIAILAGGLKTIYPPEHKALTAFIAKQGLLLSEQPLNLRPQAHHFPIRNRLISGLAAQTIIFEAALKSGSLLTARNALDQGRDVLAVPGHRLNPRAAGYNALIRDGAALVRNAQDVLDLRQNVIPLENDKAPLNSASCQPPVMSGRAAYEPAQTSKSQLQQDILDRLSVTAISENHLIRRLARPVAECNAAITELELDQKLLRHAGGHLSLRP